LGFRVREWELSAKFTDAIALEALESVVPPAVIQAAAARADSPTVRRRKLPAEVTLLLCLAMSLWTQHALEVVLAKMVHGLRLFWSDPDLVLASKGAIAQARARLGVRPVVALFHAVCRPLATPQTPGAFRFGLRLMALDGTTEDVPDSPANARLRSAPERPRRQCLPAGARGLPERARHPCGSGRWVLALPHQ
jgi:hypothetical protein